MNEAPANGTQPSAGVWTMFRRLPTGIWALGFVSMLMDTSSELVHSLLPVFMVSVLGVSMVTVGIVEGVAEATASCTKVFSGALSDYLRKRKFLAVLGYGLAAITKPLFAVAPSIGWVFTARFVDRIGKGIRGAPRDALVAEITPAGMRGAAYGLRQSLDSIGAFIGPLLALMLMACFSDEIRVVFWFAVLPAFVAVGLLIVAVREPDHVGGNNRSNTPFILSGAKALPLRYWFIVSLGAVFTLARFSEAFLVLRAQSVGLAIGYAPVVLIVMNVVYAAAAYPAGIASDRIKARNLLIGGFAILIVSDIILAAATAPFQALVGTALWGAHMGLTQGLLSKLVADASPTELMGTAFGIFGLVSGGALLLASLIAGAMWTALGPPATFMAGGVFAGVAVCGLIAYNPRSRTT